MDDVLFCFLIKEVESCKVESNLDGIAAARLRSRGNASDKCLLLIGLLRTYLEVEVDFSTHKLGYVNVCVNNALGESVNLDLAVVDTFGSETCNNFLVNVFSELFGLKLAKTPKEEIKRRVEEAAKILDIAHLLERKPKALSGGQKQRVALGRAIVRNPKVFLLDEPLSNLDAKLRAAMRTELTKLHDKVQTTFIYVTHDQVEAMTMATRIVVMKDGLIQQVDTPQNLYDSPCNIFVAGFIGTPQMNFINGTLTKKGSDVYFNFDGISVKFPKEKAENPALAEYIGKEVVVGLRPEAISDSEKAVEASDEAAFAVDVDVTELMGAEIYLYLKAGEETNLIARVSSRSLSRAGDKINVAFDMSRLHVFDKDTERCVIH